MKEFSASLKSSFQAKVTTIAKCIKIIRRDGETYRFTSFDEDLEIDGETYISAYSFNPTAYNSALGLQIENMEIEGAVDFLNINDLDIVKNLFYGAEAWIFAVDYKNIAAGKDKILYGTLGEVEVSDKIFKFEIRGHSKKYNTLYSPYFGRVCRARLGDSKCGLNLSAVYLNTDRPAVNMKVPGKVTLDGEYSIKSNYFGFRFKTSVSSASTGFRIRSIRFISTIDEYMPAESITSNASGNWRCSGDSVDNNLTYLIDDNPNTYICAPVSNYYTSYFYINMGYSSNVNKVEIVDDVSLTGYKIEEVELYTSTDGIYWLRRFVTLDDSYRSGNTITIPMSHFLPSSLTKYRFMSNDITPANLVNFGLIINDENINVNASNIFQYGNILWTSGLNKGLETEVIQNDEFGNVELAIPMPFNINAGDEFIITVGCNHLLYGNDGTINSGHCKTKFNNILNFRGEPYLPNEDVILSGFIGSKVEREAEDDGKVYIEPVDVS